MRSLTVARRPRWSMALLYASGMAAAMWACTTAAMAAGIDSVNHYAWSENGGWIDFLAPEGNVVVTGTGMTGYAWTQNYGWINLNPPGGGVLNDGNGTLSGDAWGENTGWIDFGGVTIDSFGYFQGYASGSVLGRISFNCGTDGLCGSSNFSVQSVWRAPASSSASSATANGGHRGGGGGTIAYASSASSAGLSFSDVREDDRYHDAIVWLAERGTVQGYDDGTYRPKQSINRAEFTKILTLAGYGNEAKQSCVSDPFPDVVSDAWYSPYICFAKDKSIVEGYPSGWFHPENVIDIAEAAKIVVRSLHVPYATGDGEWYQPYIDALNSIGALDTQNPAANLSRGEMAYIIWKALQ